jgi:hypothetical protein
MQPLQESQCHEPASCCESQMHAQESKTSLPLHAHWVKGLTKNTINVEPLKTKPNNEQTKQTNKRAKRWQSNPAAPKHTAKQRK